VRRADKLAPSCADCLKIWEPEPPGTVKAYNGIALPFHWAVLLFKVVFFKMTDTAIDSCILYVYSTFCSYRFHLITYMTTKEQTLALFM
jgi:hypothetical protein